MQIETIPDFLKYKKKHAHIFAKKERMEEEIQQCLLPMNDRNQRIITNALKFKKDFEEKLLQIYQFRQPQARISEEVEILLQDQ